MFYLKVSKYSEAAIRRFSIKVSQKISQNSQKNTLCQSLFFNKFEGLTQIESSRKWISHNF